MPVHTFPQVWHPRMLDFSPDIDQKGSSISLNIKLDST